jgi:hypothetical protein
LAIAAWIGIAAARIGKNQWGAFFLAVAVTWLYLAVGFPRLRLPRTGPSKKPSGEKNRKTWISTNRKCWLARELCP